MWSSGMNSGQAPLVGKYTELYSHAHTITRRSGFGNERMSVAAIVAREYNASGRIAQLLEVGQATSQPVAITAMCPRRRE